MKINVFPIVSSLHNQERINEETKTLLAELIIKSNLEIEIVDVDRLYDGDLPLILIQSGGSEQLFLENYAKLKPPFYLLTYGTNNSLAASLEILSYLKDNDLEGEVLHGSTTYLTKRINEILEEKRVYRYGVIGKPSDWLISSNVNYKDARDLHKVRLIDIDINEVINHFNKIDDSLCKNNFGFQYDEKELTDAIRLYLALFMIKKEYRLDGLTIRCFDLLSSIKTTACLGLALFNLKNIVSTCEGDVPTMLTMHILNKVTGQVGFQANPSRINVDDSTMVFAHCTLPLNMPKTYKLDSHFESGIGVAVKGELKEEKVTIFKLSKNLKDYYVTTGTIIRNLNEPNLCRTQIEVKVDENIEYFLTRPYGNHHVIIYGDHKEELENYMQNI